MVSQGNILPYHPVQPAADFNALQVGYQEFLPHPALRSCIYCYWELCSQDVPDTGFPYRVVADGCIDVFFDLNDCTQSTVMGFSNRAAEFLLGPSFHYVGIRFLPAQFPLLFRVKASELSNRSEALEHVASGLARYLKDLEPVASLDLRLCEQLDHYFLQQMSRTKPIPDNRLLEALHIILTNGGMVQVEKDLDTGISPRQLRRLFDHYVGDTPKIFSKIVRFQHLLRHTGDSRRNKSFFDAGYYDQAHFIRDFRLFYGDTPGKIFR